jgi:outer membrane protein OmpA-like peptidoglycan-associated protein
MQHTPRRRRSADACNAPVDVLRRQWLAGVGGLWARGGLTLAGGGALANALALAGCANPPLGPSNGLPPSSRPPPPGGTEPPRAPGVDPTRRADPVPQALPAPAPSVAGSAPGPARGAGEFSWNRNAEAAQTAFTRYLGGGAVVRRSDDDRVWVVLPGDGSFADGKTLLEMPARRWLDQVALVMKAWPQAELRVVGHSGARVASADQVSLERATAVRDWLLGRGVATRRVDVAGRGAREAGGAGGDRRIELLLGERSR